LVACLHQCNDLLLLDGLQHERNKVIFILLQTTAFVHGGPGEEAQIVAEANATEEEQQRRDDDQDEENDQFRLAAIE